MEDKKTDFLNGEIERPFCLKEFTHQAFTLENGIRVMVIQHPEVDMAAACLTVGAGSLHEQNDRLGMAHFCEHMCFLGTKNYPDESEYMQYISSNGGSLNASTALMETNYFFSVRPTLLSEALDRFSAFFFCPLFAPNCVGREVNAVQSEHNRYMQFDNWRHYSMLSHIANPDHPLSQFRTGTYETLMKLEEHDNDKEVAERSLRDSVIQFYDKYYSGNLMSLCVLTAQPMEEAIAMIHQKFKSIPDKKQTNDLATILEGKDIPAFRPEDKQKLYLIVPNTETKKSCDFVFYMKMQYDKWESHPERFISHLIGYEGKGSLLSCLKSLSFATSLNASVATDRVGVCMFDLCIECTDQGLENIKEIGCIVFTFLRHVAENAGEATKELFHEYKQLCEVSYRFQSLAKPMSLVQHVGKKLLYYPSDKCHIATEVPLKYSAENCIDAAAELTPENCNVILTAAKFEPQCNQLEKYFMVKFEREDLSPEWMSAWKSAFSSEGLEGRLKSYSLHLPHANEFMPTSFDIHPVVGETDGVDVPKSLSCEAMEFFHRQDRKFNLPKVVMSCHFVLECLQMKKSELLSLLTTPETSTVWTIPKISDPNLDLAKCGYVSRIVMVDLIAGALQETLNEFSYDAQMAGLQYDVFMGSSVGKAHRSLGLRVFGFDDTLSKLFSVVLQALENLKIPADKFAIALENKIKSSYRFVMNCDAYVNAESGVHALVIPDYISPKKRLAVIEAISPEVFYKVFGSANAETGNLNAKSIFNCFHALGLVEGNLTSDSAISKFADLVDTAIVKNLRDKPFDIHSDNYVMSRAVDLRAIKPLLEKTAAKNGKEIKKLSKLEKPGDSRIGVVLHSPTWNPEIKSGATVMSISFGHPSARSAAFLTMFVTYFGQKFFNDLRTRQQLGYICSSRLGSHGTTSNISFICQSSKPSAYCLARIEEFLAKQFPIGESGSLETPDLSPAEYEELRHGVIARLSEVPKKLADQHVEFLVEVESHRLDFTRREKRVEFLKSEEAHMANFQNWIKNNIVFNTFVACCIDPESTKVEGESWEKGFEGRDDREWYLCKDEKSLHRMIYSEVSDQAVADFYIGHFDPERD